MVRSWPPIRRLGAARCSISEQSGDIIIDIITVSILLYCCRAVGSSADGPSAAGPCAAAWSQCCWT